MKKIVLGLSILLAFSFAACAQSGGHSENSEEGIHWLTFEQAEQKMKEHPKKVLVDIYTSWCGWCKVMARKTYTNPQLIKYVNYNFYAIKFDAEQKEPVTFMGKKWEFVPASRANQLAVQLMNGRMSYPTTVFMEEGFKNPQAIPGYLEVYKMEGVLKFIGENIDKKMSWADFQHDFKPEWEAK